MKAPGKTALFLTITFVVSYSLAGLYKLSGGSGHDTIRFTVLGVFYMFTPMIAAIIVKKLVNHESIKDLLISFKINKWFFIAWGLMPIMSLLTL